MKKEKKMIDKEMKKNSLMQSLGGNEFIEITKERFMKTYNSRKSQKEKIPTGVEQIDQLIGGIQKGKVTSLLGITGSLKSTWALNIGYLAKAQGLNVLYVALEMSQYEIMCNLLSRHSNSGRYSKPLTCSNIKNSCLTEEEQKELYTTIFSDYEQLPRKDKDCK